MRTRPRLLVAAFLGLLLVALPAAAQSQQALPDIPGLPPNAGDLLPKAEVERFEVTVHGNQQTRIEFAFDAAPEVSCALSGSGSLNESWSYARGKGVEISFRKLGPGVVVLQRAGRGLGDAALAVKGSLRREASGTVEARAPIDCASFPLKGPACGKTHSVNSDLRLGWEKGKLTMEESSTENTVKNPALACGMTPVWNFDVLDTRFPALYPQRGALTLGQIFNSKQNLKVKLRANYLEPADAAPGYSSFKQSLGGFTTVTLKRL